MLVLRLAVLCALLAGAAAAQPIQRAGEPAGLYADAASGMTFPPEAGSFKRINLTRGPEPGDLQAFYLHAGEDGRMSVSVFLNSMRGIDPPVPQPCATYEDLSRRSAQIAHPGLLKDKQVPPLAGLAGMTGTGFSQSWSEPNGTAWISDKLHYCRDDGRWAVEIQFFHPAALDGAAALESGFLQDFAWTVTH
jgi:hypothetical protein